jgi:hypothetical protein
MEVWSCEFLGSVLRTGFQEGERDPPVPSHGWPLGPAHWQVILDSGTKRSHPRMRRHKRAMGKVSAQVDVPIARCFETVK